MIKNKKNSQNYKRIMKLESKYNKKNSQRFDDKKRTLNHIANMCKLNDFEKKEALDIITRIKNLKILCKNCSVEQIVTIICLRTKKKYNSVRIEEYMVWNRYKLNWKKYTTVSDRIGDFFYKKMPIRE
jgi:hypothetical protein